jgi:hypothetical protein
MFRPLAAALFSVNATSVDDGGGWGANGGASPWRAFRPPKPPLGKGQGPWSICTCAPTLKTMCLYTPTGAQHIRTHLLPSLLHRYYGAATPQTYIFILSCPQPGLLFGRRPPPIPRRCLPRLSKRVHANTGHPV